MGSCYEINRLPMSHYIGLLERKTPFSFVGFSDAEWFCIMKHHLGSRTGFGQVIDGDTGDRLLDILERRWQDPRFMIAVAECIWDLTSGFEHPETRDTIVQILQSRGIEPTLYARDLVLDNLAASAGLWPFIKCLQTIHPLFIVGNRYLRELSFLPHEGFFEIPFPNFHLDLDGQARLVEDIASFGYGTFLVSSGISAAMIIDALHGAMPESTFMDCGSIWDAFVGIGCQREWRRKLYHDPLKLIEWRIKCLGGSYDRS